MLTSFDSATCILHVGILIIQPGGASDVSEPKAPHDDFARKLSYTICTNFDESRRRYGRS